MAPNDNLSISQAPHPPHPPQPPHHHLPALATNPTLIFFTDFDGTITKQDSNDHLTDNYGFGFDQRKALNHAVLNGEQDFRTCFHDMMESVTKPFPECIDVLLREIELDDGFREFYRWCKGENVPVVVVSGGMRPVIEALLGKLLHSGDEEGEERLEIVSNDVQIHYHDGEKEEEEKGWEIVFRDDSSHGHDKSVELRKYSSLPNRPIMMYAGDGISDLTAARETDLLFAKEGCDLVTYCEKFNLPFRTFGSFADILATVQDIMTDRLSVEDAATGRQV